MAAEEGVELRAASQTRNCKCLSYEPQESNADRQVYMVNAFDEDSFLLGCMEMAVLADRRNSMGKAVLSHPEMPVCLSEAQKQCFMWRMLHLVVHFMMCAIKCTVMHGFFAPYHKKNFRMSCWKSHVVRYAGTVFFCCITSSVLV